MDESGQPRRVGVHSFVACVLEGNLACSEPVSFRGRAVSSDSGPVVDIVDDAVNGYGGFAFSVVAVAHKALIKNTNNELVVGRAEVGTCEFSTDEASGITDLFTGNVG